MDSSLVDLQFRLELAERYLRERGKYVLDPGCAFRPTPSTDRFSILERYGASPAPAREPNK